MQHGNIVVLRHIKSQNLKKRLINLVKLKQRVTFMKYYTNKIGYLVEKLVFRLTSFLFGKKGINGIFKTEISGGKIDWV